MTKLQTILTSLIAAIPAAALAACLVMAMLTSSENLTTVSYIFMGLTMLAAIVTALIPVAIIVGGRRKPELATVAVADSTSAAVIDAEDGEDSEGEISAASSGSFDAQDVLEESSEFDLGNSDQDMLGGQSEAEIDTEAVDDFDLEEEEAPKPKKKKR